MAGHTIQLACKNAFKWKKHHFTTKKYLLAYRSGDGTLHEALTGLGREQKHIPLGAISPLGQENGTFAKRVNHFKEM